jgi:hypothetical protein
MLQQDWAGRELLIGLIPERNDFGRSLQWYQEMERQPFIQATYISSVFKSCSRREANAVLSDRWNNFFSFPSLPIATTVVSIDASFRTKQR